MELNFEVDRTFDEDNLMEEWLNQTNLVGNYGIELAKAKKRKATLWEIVKVTKAELIKECKEDNPKATKDQIEAYYRTSPRHKKAKRALIKADHTISMLEVAYDTIRFQKKEAMKEARRIQRDEMFADEDVDFSREARKKHARQKVKRRLSNGKKEKE